jgi:hypothetical protein
MKESQMAVGLENLVYQINWILAICGKVNFNRYLVLLPLFRQGFKPLAHSESPLKRTEDCIFFTLSSVGFNSDLAPFSITCRGGFAKDFKGNKQVK